MIPVSSRKLHPFGWAICLLTTSILGVFAAPRDASHGSGDASQSVDLREFVKFASDSGYFVCTGKYISAEDYENSAADDDKRRKLLDQRIDWELLKLVEKAIMTQARTESVSTEVKGERYLSVGNHVILMADKSEPFASMWETKVRIAVDGHYSAADIAELFSKQLRGPPVRISNLDPLSAIKVSLTAGDYTLRDFFALYRANGSVKGIALLLKEDFADEQRTRRILIPIWWPIQ